MMTPYFDKPERREALIAAMDAWDGTPYRHMTQVKGRGVDCTLLVANCFKDIGALQKIEYQYYPHDWHLNGTREVVLEYMLYHLTHYMAPGIVAHEVTDPQWGDLIMYSTTPTGVSNHSTIYLEDRFFNAINTLGACFLKTRHMNLYKWNRKQIFRLYEVNQ